MRVKEVLTALRRELRDLDRFVEGMEGVLATKHSEWQARTDSRGDVPANSRHGAAKIARPAA